MIYFVTAIGTDCGKTLASAIITHAIQADYWKPVQCGTPADSETVKYLINNNHSLILKEAYFLQHPMSPHAAAKKEGATIDLNNIKLFSDNENVVIEGAGGVLVPLNENDYVIDIAAKFHAEIILVSNHYIGSINHTLLTIKELQSRNLKIKGIIFNGEENRETENIILAKSGLRCLLRINKEPEITQEVVTQYAIKLFDNWDE